MAKEVNIIIAMYYFGVFVLICSHQTFAFPQAGRRPASSSTSCVNPHGKYGQCIDLQDCPTLFGILQQHPIKRESIRFLQMSTCGFSVPNQDPKVCCIDSDNNEQQKQPSTPTQNNQNQNSNNDNQHPSIQSLSLLATPQIETNVKNHRNFKLLPTERTCGLSNALDRIVGGEETGLGTYPWMVLLGVLDYDNEIQYICGGTLINSRYVLTAAHCAKLPKGIKLTVVRIGEYDQTQDIDCNDDGICAPPAENVGIEEIIPHEDYNRKNGLEHDIALIRLSKDIKFGSFIVPICLPIKSVNTAELGNRGGGESSSTNNRNSLLVAGWGRTETNKEDGSTILLHVKVPLVSDGECNTFYKSRLSNNDIGEGRFCAGGEKDKDSCKGDSGGPVMASLIAERRQTRTYQFGIVSLGPPTCAGHREPALYTKVSQYLTWILDHLKP